MEFSDQMFCINDFPKMYDNLSLQSRYKQKHVTFSSSEEIYDIPIHQISSQDSFPLIKPAPILKKTNYKYVYRKNNQYFKKINDIIYLFVMIIFLMFFEKALQKFT